MTTTTGRKIRARYSSKCLACGRKIDAGDECRWYKGEGVEHADREICDMYLEQDAEMKAEEAFEMRITGAWAYNPEYGGYDEPSEPDDYDGRY